MSPRDRFESSSSVNQSVANIWDSPLANLKERGEGSHVVRGRSFTEAFRGGVNNRIGLNQLQSESDAAEHAEKISNGDSVDRLVHNIYSLATWAATTGDAENAAFELRLACRCHALYLIRNSIYKDVKKSILRSEVIIIWHEICILYIQ